MRQLLIYCLLLIMVLLEGLGIPWVSIWGVSLPLAFAALLIAAYFNSASLPWIGLVIGLSMDILTANAFGSMTLYFFVVSILISREVDHLLGAQLVWWYKALILAVAVFLQPWYALVVNGQYDLVSASTALVAFIRMVAVTMASIALFAMRFRKISLL